MNNMTREYVPVDIANAPDLKRLAESVRQTGKPHALKEGAETVAVVRPAPKRERPSRSGRQAGPSGRGQASPMNDPALAKLIEDDLRANREAPVDRDALFAAPSPELTARRKAILAQIEAHLPQRVITPLTAADLIHEARALEEEGYGRGRP
jgi:hypothetical protein